MTTAEAFNDGSDARIFGIARERHPDLTEHGVRVWQAGWDDADQHWGENEKRRAVKPLPEVQNSQRERRAG